MGAEAMCCIRAIGNVFCIMLSIICGSYSAYCAAYDRYYLAGGLFIIYLISSLYAFYDIIKCGENK